MKRITGFVVAASLFVSGTVLAGPGTSLDSVAKSVSLELHGTLVAFNAASGKNFFELNWNAVSPSGAYFILERSYDGSHFQKLGRLDSQNGSATGAFSYRDNIRPIVARNNDFYYRLKQVNPDGSSTYSKMLIARMFNTPTLAALSVTPDPLANDVVVNVQLKENAFVSMRVSDADGNVVLMQAQHAAAGQNGFTLADTHNLHPGLYTLEIVVNSKERMTMKLAKS